MEKGPGVPLPAGLSICPASGHPVGPLTPARFLFPILIFASPPALPFSCCIFVINSFWQENTAQSYVSFPSMRKLSPNLSPPLSASHPGRSAMLRSLLSSRHRGQRLSLTILFNTPAPTEAHSLPVPLSPR